MPSYRRKAIEVETVMDDFDSKTPEDIRASLKILDDVAKIAVEGYTTVTVTIKGRPEELRDLAEEIKTWTPVGGWSSEAQKLFLALEGEDT